MANFKFVKSATALVLGASVLTSAVVVPGANASAKTTYKVNKNGTLVNAKTNKTVKGYVSYKGKLYKDGKKFTGLYNKKYYYKSGVKATGTYKGAYYVKGVKKVTTGTYNGKYYVKGALYTGKTSKNVYYVKGVKFTGVTKYGYTYKDGKRVEGEYQGKVYTNGKLVTGVYKDKLYKAGVLVKGFALEKEKLYKDGVLNIGLALFQEKLYNNSDLATGIFTYNGVEDQYKDGVVVPTKVESVSAVNPKTVTLTGTNLSKLTAADVTIEGTKVTGLTVSTDRTTATLTLETAVNENQEYKVSVKTPTGTQDLTLKYTLNIGEVAVTTQTVEENKDGQKLAISLNGVATDLASVVDTLGYDVEFQANKAVFANGSNPATTTSLTGEIDENATAVVNNGSFDVQVVLKKNGKTITSKTATVKVVSDATPAINDLVLSTAALGDLKGKTISTKDSGVKVSGVLSNTGDVVDISGKQTFTSSNPKVATIDATGNISPIKAGTTTITVVAGKVSYSTTITVADEKRVATKATPAYPTVALAPGKSFVNNIAITDQFGEKLALADIDGTKFTAYEKGTNETAATFAALGTPADGKGQVSLTATTKTGTYTVYVRDNNTGNNIGQFNVSITADNTADNYKLALAADDTTGGTLNVSNGATPTLVLNANSFTKTGGFLANIDTDVVDAAAPGKFLVQSANPNVATVAVAAGNKITVTGKKAGSTQIILKDPNGTQVATYTVTVVDKEVVIKTINWKNDGATISNTDKTLTYEDIFNVAKEDGKDSYINGVTLSTATTSKVRIDNGSITSNSLKLYLDSNDNGKYDAGEEILGNVTIATIDALGDTVTSAGTWDAILATASGNKGTFVFKVTDDDNNSTVVESSTLNINVK